MDNMESLIPMYCLNFRRTTFVPFSPAWSVDQEKDLSSPNKRIFLHLLTPFWINCLDE